ncbi:MAG: CDP-alcohol phosphatidyltransferase family protein [Planctomycetota bacterium]
MLDSRVRSLIDPMLDHIGSLLARFGLSANIVTVGGFLLGVAGCIAIGFQHYWIALTLLMLNRIADGLDGSIARRRGATDVGGYLDIVLDMIFYSGVPFAFAVSRAEFALPAAFLIYSFIGTGGSFLAYAAIAAKRGVTTDSLGKKSFYYAAGLIEGTETVVFFVLCCLWHDRFAVLAWTFGALCWVTTAARIAAGVIAFREPR